MNISTSLRSLILETSGRVGQVGVACGATLLASRYLEESRRHARDLGPAVANLLLEQGWKPSDVQAIFVSLGPGSYTGLRVGIMSAKAFAYATGCALISVETFAVVALQAPATVCNVEVLADAQQRKLYLQHFVRQDQGGMWLPINSLSVQTLDHWLIERDPEAWVTGPGLAILGQHLPASVRQLDSSTWDPRVESVLQSGLVRLEKGEQDSPWTVEPLYLRASSAEEKWQERSQNK